MALPPEKTDGLASGDEKRMEKPTESCPGSRKPLKFEVSILGRRDGSLLRGAFQGRGLGAPRGGPSPLWGHQRDGQANVLLL